MPQQPLHYAVDNGGADGFGALQTASVSPSETRIRSAVLLEKLAPIRKSAAEILANIRFRVSGLGLTGLIGQFSSGGSGSTGSTRPCADASLPLDRLLPDRLDPARRDQSLLSTASSPRNRVGTCSGHVVALNATHCSNKSTEGSIDILLALSGVGCLSLCNLRGPVCY